MPTLQVGREPFPQTVRVQARFVLKSVLQAVRWSDWLPTLLMVLESHLHPQFVVGLPPGVRIDIRPVLNLVEQVRVGALVRQRSKLYVRANFIDRSWSANHPGVSID